MFDNECVNKQLYQVLIFHAVFSVFDAASTIFGLTYIEHVREINVIMGPIVETLGPSVGMVIYLIIMAAIGLWIYFFNNILHNQFSDMHEIALSFPISGLWMTNILRLTVVLNNLGYIFRIPFFISGEIDRFIMIPIGYIYGLIKYRMCN